MLSNPDEETKDNGWENLNAASFNYALQKNNVFKYVIQKQWFFLPDKRQIFVNNILLNKIWLATEYKNVHFYCNGDIWIEVE